MEESVSWGLEIPGAYSTRSFLINLHPQLANVYARYLNLLNVLFPPTQNGGPLTDLAAIRKRVSFEQISGREQEFNSFIRNYAQQFSNIVGQQFTDSAWFIKRFQELRRIDFQSLIAEYIPGLLLMNHMITIGPPKTKPQKERRIVRVVAPKVSQQRFPAVQPRTIEAKRLAALRNQKYSMIRRNEETVQKEQETIPQPPRVQPSFYNWLVHQCQGHLSRLDPTWIYQAGFIQRVFMFSNPPRNRNQGKVLSGDQIRIKGALFFYPHSHAGNTKMQVSYRKSTDLTIVQQRKGFTSEALKQYISILAYITATYILLPFMLSYAFNQLSGQRQLYFLQGYQVSSKMTNLFQGIPIWFYVSQTRVIQPDKKMFRTYVHIHRDIGRRAAQLIFGSQNDDGNDFMGAVQLIHDAIMELVPREFTRQLNTRVDLQTYLTTNNNDQYLRIQNMYMCSQVLQFKTAMPRNSARVTQLANLTYGRITNTFVIWSSPRQRLPYMLDWTFYMRKQKLYLAQLQPPQQTCITQLNQQLAKRNLPSFSPNGRDHVLYAFQYCAKTFVNLRILGFPQLSMDNASKQQIVISPRHVELVNTKRKFSPSKQSIARYDQRQQNGIHMDTQVQRRPTAQQWTLGQQLPLDPQLNAQTQLILRCKCIVIDIQTLAVEQQVQKPYMICAVGYLDKGMKLFHRCWSNTQIGDLAGQPRILGSDISQGNCIKYFVQWLGFICTLYTSKEPLVIWGYNTMGFQIAYLLKQLTIQFGNVQLQGSPSQCKSFSVCSGAIMFVDVLKILRSQKLFDACRQFNIVVKKQQLDIKLYDNWQMITRDYQKIRQYCFYDCISALLLIHKVQCGFITISQSLNMTTTVHTLTHKFTASGLGWHYFIQGFLKRNITTGQQENDQDTIYNNEPEEIYAYQRKSFTGGVVQVFQYIEQSKVFVVDVNSMYPAMLLRDLPWRYIGQAPYLPLPELLREPDSNMYLFQVQRYELPAHFLGAFVATKQVKGGKNTYYNAYNKQQPIYLRGVTVRRILYHGGSVNYLRCWRYNSGSISAFKQFAQTFYKQRLVTKSASLKQCYKLLMNSVIGRCSMHVKSKYRSTICPTYQDFMFMDDQFFLQCQPQQQPAVGRLVRLTAYITDCAKVYLDQLAQKAGYTNVLYCDTDSLIVKEAGYIKLGSPGTKASLLGQFKCQGPKNSYNNYYDAGYFKNRKDYILTYTTKQGETDYVHKAKGIPKRFINRQYTQMIISCMKSQIHRVLQAPTQTTIDIGTKIKMKVWRKGFGGKQGVTIKDMLKKSTIIVDRFFIHQRMTGIPRIGQQAYICIQEHQDQDFL